MKPDTVLTLTVGSDVFTFSRFEIPERIQFGGRQRLATQELIGGRRVVDAMGRSDMPIVFSGLFQGENALARARYLDGLRISGKQGTLTWSEFSYSVVIEEFTADFERFYKLPYRISFMVVADNTSPVTAIADPGVDSLLRDDMATASGYGASINDPTLSSALSVLDASIKAVSNFATATQSTINTVLGPIAAVTSRVNVLIASTGNTLANASTLGGLLPANGVSQRAAQINAQVAAAQSQPTLYRLNSVMGRMTTNLGTIGGGSTKQAVAGGNLFQMAAKAYGDASNWTTIANANKLTDPKITGIQNLTVPSTPDNSGGVLAR